MRILDIGGNDKVRASMAYPDASITLFDKKNGFDVTQNPLPMGEWDIILINHLIEHLVDPDDLLDKCYRIMSPDTILEISTPNILSWYNRLFMLLGYLPYCYEVSYRHLVGRPPFLIKGGIGGHVRLFSTLALSELLENHDFDILSIEGEGSIYPNKWVRILDSILTINPNIAANVRIRCRKIQ